VVEQRVEEEQSYRQYAIEEYYAFEEPYYLPIGSEVPLFNAAFEQQNARALEGPWLRQELASSSTWPGSWAGRSPSSRTSRRAAGTKRRTVSSRHRRLTGTSASDLVGRYLSRAKRPAGSTALTAPSRRERYATLDEVVEAVRTTVLIHP
jgi:nitric oxide reductase NorQ protein